MKTFQLIVFILFYLAVGTQGSFAQCGSCTITFSGNGNPTPNRNIQDGDVVCITGLRTNRIDFEDADNLTICISSGSSYEEDFRNLEGENVTINNYGSVGRSNRNLEISNDQTLNNFGSLVFRNVNVSSGGTVNNSGAFEVTRDLNNRGTFNSSEGVLTVDRDLRNIGGVFSSGNTSVSRHLRNDNLITLAGSLVVGSNLYNNDDDAIIRPLNTNQCNTISVGGDIDTDDGTITGNNLTGPFKAPLIVNKSPDDGNLTGGAIVDSDLDCDDTSGPPPSGCWRYIDDGSESGTVIIEFFEDCTWEAPANLAEFEVLTVGGGGGGGFDLGGGGGAGGLVHTRAVVTEIEGNGLPANTTFEIKVGSGGEGSDDEDEEGQDGSESTFDLGGIYEVRAAGGGGGGNGSWNKRKGNNGTDSYYNETTIGYSVVEETTGDQKPRFFGSSGGGAGNEGNNNHRGQGGNNGRNGGRGNDGAGGGGGGAAEDGNNAAEERGGKGGAGQIVTEFDNRVYAAGGGGAGEDDRGFGGANLRGGNGAEDDDEGEEGQTPGSGGGGGGDDRRGGRGSNGVVIVRYEIARILPVEFLSFQSTYQVAKRTGLLEWSTAKEWENSHFEIERAINSVDSWTKIGEIQGQGFADSPTSYSFEDINLPIQGGNIFYRLKQVDFDGTYTYSRTTAIQIEGQKGNKTWRAYPNPTNGYSFQIGMIDPSSYRDEPISIRVISPTGLYHYILVDDIQTMGKQVGDWLIGQTAGIYTIEIVWGTNREYHKVILKR